MKKMKTITAEIPKRVTIILDSSDFVGKKEANSLVMEIVSKLTDKALSIKYGKPVENMCNADGTFMEKYQDEFNRLYDKIEYSIKKSKYLNQTLP